MIRCSTQIIIFALCAATASAQNAPAIAPKKPANPFTEALARARQERRYLLVSITKDDDEAGTAFNSKTLGHDLIKNWTDHRATILKLSDSDPVAKKLAKQYKIDRSPALLIFASDGTQLGKQVGDSNPERLMKVIAASIRNRAIRGDAGIHSWSGEDVVLNIMDRADALTDKGEYDKALEELNWCMDHPAIHSPLFPVRHMEKLCKTFAKLSQKHPPAKKAFRLRLSRAEFLSLEKERPNVHALYLIKYGFSALDREDKILLHFDRLKGKYPGSHAVSAFADLIYEPLLNAKRYTDLKHTVEDPENVDTFLGESQRTQRSREEVRRLIAARYEILRGLGKSRQADGLAYKVIAYDDSPEAHLALAAAALRSTHSTDKDIEHARTAYLKMEGNNIEAVMTLAKLIAQKTAKDPEAEQIVRLALTRFKDESDLRTLTQCLYDIQSGKIPSRKKANARTARPRR